MFNQKDLLAKLLATEDVTVMHANAKTASFDVKNRVLTLPVWNDMTNETYDHLTGHEVGHALYTPFEGWEKELKKKDMGPGFKSFLNVVEDARIEKLIQRRYPGLRRSFVMSYKKMIADGFFGGDIDKINTYPIIDRINTFFKAGPTAGVLIETDEQVWVDEIEKLETWDEVVDVATRLYEYAKLKKEEENELAQEMEHEFGDEDEDGEFGDEDEDGEFDNDEFGDESIDGESESIEGLESDQTSDDETDDEDATGESNIKGAGDDDVKSKTDEALSQNINANYNNDSGIEVKNIMLNTADVSPLIVDYKTIISDFEEFDIKRKAIGESIDYMGNSLLLGKRGEKLFTKFMANNKKSIAYLVKEFEMKKSAKEYVRATTAKTGVIDPVKMNSYLYNDDIFKKVTTIPEGKSHGMIMYLDWSGSMHYDMKATMDQLLNLVNFSRIVNIPFRVYAFTTGYQLEGSTEKLKGNNLFYDEVNADTVYYEDKFRYLELFNSKMNKKDFIQMQKYMLAFGSDPRTMPYQYQLHGTPLDVSLMGASSLHGMFLKQHRVDIVNTIVLTDGDSHNAPVKTVETSTDYDGEVRTFERSSGLNDLFGWRFKGQVNVIDPVTKKRYPLTMETNRIEVTDMFLKIYRERTGSTTIGFRILPTQINRIRRELVYLPYDTDYSELSKAMRNDKYCVIPSNGYDKYFGIGGGNDLKTANGAFEVSDDATTAQLRNAFKKASKNKVNSRALLNEFIREVA
jgi:hypothetical protein